MYNKYELCVLVANNTPKGINKERSSGRSVAYEQTYERTRYDSRAARCERTKVDLTADRVCDEDYSVSVFFLSENICLGLTIT